jgi:hypothetical protein
VDVNVCLWECLVPTIVLLSVDFNILGNWIREKGRQTEKKGY